MSINVASKVFEHSKTDILREYPNTPLINKICSRKDDDVPRKRNNRIHIYLSDEEYEHINNCAKNCGISREQYTRMLYKGVIPPPVISKEVNDVLKQLRRIGNNMNQIAHIANTANSIDKQYYDNCYKELQDQILEIKTILLESRELNI